MLTIKNIGELIGHKFEDGFEVLNISTVEIDYPNSYSIQLAKYTLLYNPMTFTPNKRISESRTIILDRMGFKGAYRMWNPIHIQNSLRLDISLMDKKEKMIAAIKFIM
jgi:hypothetical protein